MYFCLSKIHNFTDMMNRKLFLAMLLAGSAAMASADEARLLRFPATNGNQVVFTYAGDLYTVSINGGEAKRLTSHVGYEMFAKFSPDGQSIAFTGEYDGNREVYLMPANGGEPKRLTYTSTNSRDDLGDRMGPNNIVMAWTNDGKQVVYRNRIGDGFEGQLWTIGKDGGMSEQIPLPEGGWVSFSPDGKQMAYNRVMREFRTWKYYRGGMADDIWIYDPQQKTVVNVTDNIAQDIMPMWIGDEIFFISDRDMTMNIFAYNTKTKQTTKVTNYTDFDVKFPSSNGKFIVYENAGYLYKLDPATRQSTKISITLASDNIYGRAEQRNVSNRISSISVTDDGSRLAITARGDVFDVPATQGVVKNITRTPGANERGAVWSPDGKYIAYISDKTGETEVYLQPADGSNVIQLTKNNDTYVRSLFWTPDSKKVFYTDRKNRLVAVDVASKSKKTVMENPEQEFRGIEFSADSKWITYTKPASNDMSVVYVYNLETGKEYPVTEKWYSSSSPTFSTDGKYIIFTSNRDLNPTYSSVEWDYAYTNMGAVYLATLAADTPSPLLPKDDVVGAADNKPAARPGADAAKSDAPAALKIDPDGISGRIIKLPIRMSGYGGGFFSDGKKLYYSSGQGTRVFDFATQEDKEVLQGGRVQYRAGAKKAVVNQRGKVYVVNFPADRVSLDKAVNTDNLVATVDFSEEWPQIYDEVWRAFRDGYYVENMHGRDWKALKEKYAVLLPYVKTRLDLNYVIGELISELASGHAYVSTGEKPEAERIDMGLLGAEISRDRSGFYRIDKIMEGAPYSESLRSPLTEPGIGVKEGEFITAIDGIPTNTVDNIYKLLVGKANVLTELTVNSNAAAGGRKVVIKPIANEYPLVHYAWVQNNIRKVEKATNGRVGYIYIPDMSAEGLNEFARYYYPQLDKEALIIDDRANGGGNVSPMIIERLLRQPYRMTMSRTSTRTETVPDGTQVGPKVLLINKYSASDGDLFPWSFKANNLGTVIGTRTWGGIVGISGSLPYLDNTDVRVPFFTNYDYKTGQWIVENHGVDPDILIDNDPIKEFNGEDQQLNKAIEVALEQLKTRQAPPKVPAPRTFPDLGLPQMP